MTGPCSAVSVAAIGLTLFDSQTSAPPASSITAIASDGAYADTARSSGGMFVGKLYLAYSRPGTYTIAVRGTGYVDWNQPSVVVPADACGEPEMVELAVTLYPSVATTR